MYIFEHWVIVSWYFLQVGEGPEEFEASMLMRHCQVDIDHCSSHFWATNMSWEIAG